jgi:copper chaperone CopZ
MEQQIQVENIKCGGCMNSIIKALEQLPLVKDVQIVLETETITVLGDVDRALLVDKLNALGYPERGHNTTMKKAKSFVSCAMGKFN